MTITEFLFDRFEKEKRAAHSHWKVHPEWLQKMESWEHDSGTMMVTVRWWRDGPREKFDIGEFRRRYTVEVPDEKALRAVKVKMKLLDMMCQIERTGFDDRIIRCMASEYEDHPDYQQEWAR
jgi:Family of unknown function (DUF6221)